MSFHTKRSPSQAKRFLACSGALALCETLPDVHRNQAGIAAQIGTAAHGLAERCLEEGSNPEDYRGRIIELIGDEESAHILRDGAKLPGSGKVFFEVDSDMIDGVEMLTTYVRQRLKELGVDRSAVQLETRTNPLPERDDTSGTADVSIDAWPVMLEVVDYKNGWNVVEHKDNEQLLAYLLGKAIESDFAHELFRVTVVQPNAPHEEGRIRSFDATKQELIEFQKRYRAGIKRCEEAEDAVGAPCRDGSKAGHHYTAEWSDKWLEAGDHCLFCDAQAVCPARIALAQEQAKIDFADEPNEILFKQSEDEVAKIMRWLPQLEAFSRAVAMYAQRALENGYDVPGFKLVHGRSVRKFRDDWSERKLIEAMLKGGFVKSKSALFTPPKLISGPAAEKLVPKDKRKKFGEKFLVKPEGNLTVTHEDDPREAVLCHAGDDFDDDF